MIKAISQCLAGYRLAELDQVVLELASALWIVAPQTSLVVIDSVDLLVRFLNHIVSEVSHFALLTDFDMSIAM